MSLRSASVTFTFAVLLGFVAILARAVAVTTTGAWFSPAISLQVYSIATMGGIVVAVALGAVAAIRSAHIDDSLRSLDVRIGILSHLSRGSGAGADRRPRSEVPSDQIGVVEVLSRPAAAFAPGPSLTDRLAHDALLTMEEMASAAGPRELGALEKILMAQRDALRSARDRLWFTVAGPLVGAIVFVAIGSIMLPGSEGFAAGNFQLNTTLILTLAYGWALLLVWTGLAFAMLPTTVRRKRIFRPRLWERVE